MRTIQKSLAALIYHMEHSRTHDEVDRKTVKEAADLIDELIEALEKSEYIIMEYHNRYKFEHRDDYTYRNPASEAIAKAKGK